MFTNDYYVRIHQLSKSYPLAGSEVLALRDFNLELRAGSKLAIVGKSGSGKSTLLNLLAGLDRPSTGEVWVGGVPVHTLDESGLAAWRGRHVGVVFQFFQLLPTLTVIENVMLPLELAGIVSLRAARARAEALLDQVGILEQAQKLPSTLSGGQQQRAAIARALANDPALVVADEPTGNLDTATAQAVLSLLEGLAEDGKTVVVVTHEAEIARRFDQVVTLVDGHQQTANTPEVARV